MIITSKLDKKDCGCHIYHKLYSATHLPKKPTGPQRCLNLYRLPQHSLCVSCSLSTVNRLWPLHRRTSGQTSLVYSSSLHFHECLRPLMNMTCMYQAISRPRFDARWISTERTDRDWLSLRHHALQFSESAGYSGRPAQNINYDWL